MQSTTSIDYRFRGPEDSGNGGYTCGILAQALSGDVEVRLKSPPPLNTELTIETDDGQAQLLNGDQPVAVASETNLELDIPAFPETAEAEQLRGYTIAPEDHILPTCFVCGPLRDCGDGLRIFPAPLESQPVVVAHWTPDATLIGSDNNVAAEFVWAALDCPGYFALQHNIPMLLGTMTGSIDRLPEIGREMLVVGWLIDVDGRKYHAGTALFDHAGQLYGKSRQTWIALKTQ